MVVATSADSRDKLPLLVIGKARLPCWVVRKPSDVQYICSAKGWMAGATFRRWI